jgi:putative acetyltransferase
MPIAGISLGGLFAPDASGVKGKRGNTDGWTEMDLRDGVHPVRRDEDGWLLEVWEAAVRATHHFLSEDDIQVFKPLVIPGLRAMEHLLCVRHTIGTLVGFLGVADGKMEALFVHPAWHGLGVGRRLAQYAVDELGATTVDVNEQNESALRFYLRMGFRVEGRSKLDPLGKPFPILHLKWHGGASSGRRDPKN